MYGWGFTTGFTTGFTKYLPQNVTSIHYTLTLYLSGFPHSTFSLISKTNQLLFMIISKLASSVFTNVVANASHASDSPGRPTVDHQSRDDHQLRNVDGEEQPKSEKKKVAPSLII